MSRFLTLIYFSFRCPFLKISKPHFTMLAVMQALTYTYFYYIDTSVLLENIPLVKIIHKNCIRDPSGLFSIISHVSLSMT